MNENRIYGLLRGCQVYALNGRAGGIILILNLLFYASKQMVAFNSYRKGQNLYYSVWINA